MMFWILECLLISSILAVDKRPQRQPGNQYSFDGRHLQERNVPVPSGYSDLSSHGYSYSQARPASERVYQENVYPPKHSSSLNLSDTDKLYSGKYALDNSTNSGCGPGIMNFNQSNFNQRYTRSPVHNDWAHSFARTTSHCSLSPSRDGSVNALTKSNIRGVSDCYLEFIAMLFIRQELLNRVIFFPNLPFKYE